MKTLFEEESRRKGLEAEKQQMYIQKNWWSKKPENDTY